MVKYALLDRIICVIIEVEEKTFLKEIRPMEKKLRYAIVGCGNFGKQHLDAIMTVSGIEVVALCDIHIESCEKRKEEFGLSAKCYTDHKEMLKCEKIDVVTVASSDKAHKDATVDSLRAGCHVLCEKPMALFTEECEEMVKAADESGKLLMVGQVCRYAPGFVKAKSLVEKGVIGELYFVESEYAHDYLGREGVDGWRADKDREPIIGGACHAIDLLRWIAGDPIETSAYSNHKMLKSWPVNDTTVAIMKFPGDVIGKVFTSIGCKRDYTMRTVLYGTKGTIIVNNTDPYLTLYLDKIEGAPFADGQLEGTEEKLIRHLIKVSINNHNVAAEHRQMLDSVLNGTPLITTGREGARTVAVCRAVVESAKTGMPVKIKYTV